MLLIGISYFSFSQEINNEMEWKLLSYQIKFKIKNAGFNVDGVFTGLQTKITFDQKLIDKCYILASVESKTINTGNSARDGHLKKPDYFDVIKYPKIILESNRITFDATQKYKGIFKLTIKNKTKEIEIPFTVIEKEGKATFEGKFTINRRDFDVGGSSFILADTVELVIKANLTR